MIDQTAGEVVRDPRWEWVEEPRRLCDTEPTYVRGRCKHLEVIPVESALDEDLIVAQLCVTCNEQFPAPRQD